MEMLSDDMNLIERGRHQTREREVQKRREERRKEKEKAASVLCTGLLKEKMSSVWFCTGLEKTLFKPSLRFSLSLGDDADI